MAVNFARPPLLLTMLLLTPLLGCDVGSGSSQKTASKKEIAWKKGSPAAEKATAPGKAAVAQRGKRKKAAAVPLEGATIRSSSWNSGGVSTGGFSSGSFSENQAIEQIGKGVRQSLELGPTLVVWMFDRSDSASRLVASTLSSARALHAADDLAAAAKEKKLIAAVVGFGEKTDLLLDPPTGDADQLKAAFDAVKTEPGSRENTYAALKLVLEKYLPLRTKERHEVMVVLVTDEPGDDLPVLDSAVALAEKNAIPVYALGPSVPLGKAQGAMPEMDPNAKDKRTPAADSYVDDWVSSASGGFAGDTLDSGLGPWPLERLCRASGGSYFPVGSLGSNYSSRADRDAMAKYAPQYDTVAAVQASIAENRCRAALAEAAKLPAAKSLQNPQTSFPKVGEAEMKRMLDRAQLNAARLEESLDKTYTVLAQAEADRAKLTGLRWQVAYDTALGRAAAAKVRVDGYNAMLAALKRGKNFENPSSTTWLIEPSDTIETGSAMQKLADKAKTYLERVQKEHPGTPWAQAAEQELRMPLGWRWQEQ
jgi:hypothetical protein